MAAKTVRKSHFEEALKKVKPSVNKGVLEVYKKVEENFLKSARASLPAENSYLG
jgi:long-subunit acyl-CoA synthetase (AMP-forming)